MTAAILKQTAKDISSQIGTTMKAAVIRNFGDPDVLQYEDIARPIPKPGNVLIKVLAAGVNRLDHYIRARLDRSRAPLPSHSRCRCGRGSRGTW